MTLILTAMTPDWVAQACDCRISFGTNGLQPDDSARKLIFLHRGLSRFSVVYTGVAAIQQADGTSQPTGDWIAGTLQRVVDGPGSPIAPAVRLADELNRAFSVMAGRWQGDARLSVICSGLVDDDTEPGVVCVSNFQKGGWRLPLQQPAASEPVRQDGHVVYAAGDFSCTVVTKTSPGIGLLIHGDFRAISTQVALRLRASLRGLGKAADAAIARDALVAAIKQAAAENPGGTVSADCWSRVLRRHDPIEEFARHFRDPNKQALNPTLIGVGQRIDSVLTADVHTGEVAAVRSKLDSGLLNERIDTPSSLIAFVEWSPRIRWLEHGLSRTNLEVLAPAYVGDTLLMTKIAGPLFAGTLERHIAKAGDWVHGAINAFFDASAKRTAAMLGAPSEARLPGKANINRDVLLAFVLVALEPDKYPIEPPSGAFGWFVSAELKEIIARYRL